MKKSLVLLFFALFALPSLTANAQQSSCNVNGLNGVVATVTPLVKGEKPSGCNPRVKVTVSLSKAAPEETGVAVEIYDGKDLVASGMVYVPKGKTSKEQNIEGIYLETGKMYSARIANASCAVPSIQLP